MTQNQIAYHNARELERHNLMTEQETARHQKQQELLQHRSNELAHESNVISKEHYERMDAINATHYANQDQYNAAMLLETQRSNQASEALKAAQNAINASAIMETARHQKTMEGIESSLASNTIRKTAAEISYISENAAYTRERATNTAANTSYLYGFQTREAQSRINLNNANVGVANSQRYLNATSSTRNIINASTDIWQTIMGGVAKAFR